MHFRVNHTPCTAIAHYFMLTGTGLTADPDTGISLTDTLDRPARLDRPCV
jgi:hypothetical protein